MKRSDRIQLTVERPAAGGRMIARHDGAIVFVAGAIPGEVVDAEVEKVQRGTAWAITRQVLERSADRVEAPEGACGGSVFAHIAVERQRALKAAIIEDAFRRIGRMPLDAPVEVVSSPIDGYRMRARLHMRRGKIGFFREGTHAVCDPAPTRQLRDDTVATLRALEQRLADDPAAWEIELSENIAATERACHFELPADGDPSRLAALTKIDGLTGITWAQLDHASAKEVWGSPYVTDTIAGAKLSRHARSFFQGNRFLAATLVDHVLSLIDAGPVLDLYAGVGLFSITAAIKGVGPITAVEGDRSSGLDLESNAQGHDLIVKPLAVETFLAGQRGEFSAVIVDPPRTGLSKEAMQGVLALQSPRIVYVSCDIATLARDARLLVDAGYRLGTPRAFDLFPNTAHVETVISFSK
jgi:23S rRNA (uracil1939-C5)-methyltransferase